MERLAEETKMKRLIATLMCVAVLGIAAVPAGAQTWNRGRTAVADCNRSDRDRNDSRYGRDRSSRNQFNSDQYDRDRYDRSRYDGYRDRSIWDKHRDKITTAGGALGGAVLGGLIGGKKGAAIGAITGGAGAAIYTYKVRNRGWRH